MMAVAVTRSSFVKTNGRLVLALLLGMIPAVALAASPPPGMIPMHRVHMQRYRLTPQQRIREQQNVQRRMEQQMPPQFRAGYEKMMRQQNALERRHQSHRAQGLQHSMGPQGGIRSITQP